MSLELDLGPAAQPAEHDPLPAEAERAHRGPRRPGRADPDPGQHKFQPCLRRGAEARGVQPNPRVGVLGPPVVPDRAPPPGHRDRAAVKFETAGDLAVRDDRLELGARQRRAVQRRRAQRPQRFLLTGDGQVPARMVAGHRSLAPELSRPGGRARREGGENLLDHGRLLAAVTIDDRAPQGDRLRPYPGAMPGVAYP